MESDKTFKFKGKLYYYTSKLVGPLHHIPETKVVIYEVNPIPCESYIEAMSTEDILEMFKDELSTWQVWLQKKGMRPVRTMKPHVSLRKIEDFDWDEYEYEEVESQEATGPEDIWNLCQNLGCGRDHEPDFECYDDECRQSEVGRSMMVGDLVASPEGRLFFCASEGWVEVYA